MLTRLKNDNGCGMGCTQMNTRLLKPKIVVESYSAVTGKASLNRSYCKI